MTTIIDGKAIAAEIQEEVRQKVAKLSGRKPSLAVISVGNHPPSRIYIRRKTQACVHAGIHSIKKHFPASISEEELCAEVEDLNQDSAVDGILVQLPLPLPIDPIIVTRCISPEKDVDGFHPINVGKLLIGEKDGFFPCTPLGIKTLLERSSIPLKGKHVVIMGRSNI